MIRCCGVLDYVQLLTATVASGDPRAVIQTINATPKDFRHGTHIVMSDGDVAIVARNALILLSAFLIDDAAEAANTIIHLWYSSRLKKSHMQALEALVLPLIQAVCDKIVKKPADSLLGKTWTFQTGGSLRLVLCKENWTQLLDCLRVPDGLTAQRADQARQSVTLSPSNVDHRELKYLAMTREHRVADQKFRTDGILLPFGESRVDFTIPNP